MGKVFKVLAIPYQIWLYVLVFVPLEKAKLTGTVTFSLFKGVHNELDVDINGVKVMVNTYETYEVGESIGLSVDPYEIHMMKVEQNG